MHMCIDYRALNALIIINKYPLPHIDEFVDQLHEACYFTKIVLRLRYDQVHIKMIDVSKMGFRTQFGPFEFLFVMFGLTNATYG